MQFHHLLATASFKAFAVFSGAAPAFAQEAPAEVTSSGDSIVEDADYGGTEIIVTAQKRGVSVQKLPGTVEVLDSELLQSNQVTTMDQLNTFVPSFSLSRTAGGNVTLTVRGVGTTSSGLALEQSVAPYIDGVYAGGNQRDFAIPLYDIGRIEVLKGTQSGISGQNTSVGTINIVTRKPGTTPGGYVTAGHEFNQGSWNAQGAVDIIGSDRFRARVSGLFEDVGGFLVNLPTGNKGGARQTISGRVNAVWEASDPVTVSWFAQYDRASAYPTAQFAVTDPNGTMATLVPQYTFRPYAFEMFKFSGRSREDGEAGYEFDAFRSSLTVEADLGGGRTLTATTAGTYIDDFLSVDQDHLTLDHNWLQQNGVYWQLHQEVRVASSPADRLSWIVGIWYRHAEYDKTITFFNDANVANRLRSDIPYYQWTDTGSVYGDLQFQVTPELSIGGTLRYTAELKKNRIQAISNYPAVFTAFPLTRQRLSPSFVDGSVRLRYELTDSAMVYAMYGHGTKTGSFADITGRPLVILPEIAQTYEVGAKFRFLDNRVTFNLSAWHMDVEDFQDIFPLFGVFTAQNRDLYTRGIEVQTSVAPVDGLTIGANATYMDSKDLTDGNSKVVRSPEWSVNGTARYETALGGPDHTGALFGSLQYHSAYFNVPASQGIARQVTRTDGYAQIDLGAELRSAKGWYTRLLVQNIGNRIEQGAPTSPSYDAMIKIIAFGQPRRITLQLGYDF